MKKKLFMLMFNDFEHDVVAIHHIEEESVDLVRACIYLSGVRVWALGGCVK